MEYRTQKILLTGKIDDEAEAYLLWGCHQSNSLYNSALFTVRQAHFSQCETQTFFDKNEQYRIALKDRYVKASYAQLCQNFKANKHYIGLGGQQGQQCLKSVVEGVASYNKLLKMYWQGEIKDKPRIPRYRQKRGLYQDAMGAANILKKVAIQLGVSLAEVGREALTLPKRYDLSCLNKSYRKRCEARLKTA